MTATTDCPQQSKGVSDKLQKIAFLGPLGTYSHQAAFNRFGNNVKYIQQGTIADTFHAIPSEAEIALLPAENSIFGPVIETLDLFRLEEVGKEKIIRGSVTLQVEHCLLLARGTQLGDIKRVFSHEQALGQCSTFLKTRLPETTLFTTPSTAAAAQTIAADDHRRNSAAICSEVCAAINPDLVVLEKGIQNDNSNFTKFWIMTSSSILSVPGLESDESNTLLRISSSSGTQAADISLTIGTLQLLVKSIDRRPSLSSIPFEDVYFLHVSRPETCKPELMKGLWSEELNCAAERVRPLGWEVRILGIW